MKCVLFATLVILIPISGTTAQSAVEDHIRIARELSIERRLPEAAAEIGKAIALEPENLNLYLRRASYFNLAKDREGVRRDIERAWELAPDSERVLVTSITMLLAGGRGDCKLLMAMADSFIATNTQNDRGYEARSRAKACLGDIGGAFNDITLAAQLNPSNSVHRYRRTKLLDHLGDSNEALRTYASVVDTLEAEVTDAKSERAQFHGKRELRLWLSGRSKIHERNGDHDLALADISRTIELVPDHASYLYRARYYRRLKRYDEAITDLSRSIELEKRNAFHIYWERGDVYAEMGEYEAAIADFEQALRLMPAERKKIEERIRSIRRQIEQSDY